MISLSAGIAFTTSTALDEVYTFDTVTKELIENAYNRVKAS
jgi:hypothetical protein